MKRPTSSKKQQALATLSIGMIGVSGCTGQIPNSFRFAQQSQTFNANIEINTKIDLLWVVDNSASMDTVQDKLRQGLSGFASKYMQPTWDIRVAVITTDTYLANPAYVNYFNAVNAATTGATSPYLASRTVAFNDPTLVDGTGKFVRDVLNKDIFPVSSSPNFAKLLNGIHDGPISAFCFERHPYFLNGETQCSVRDKAGLTGNTGTSHCLNPSGSETAITQCVNTTQNNTVHSGKAIISTMPTSTLTGAALTAWSQQLADDFMVNATTGASGSGSERGFQSLLQVITDNEVAGSPTKFFRANSVRGIVFVTDEDDQSMTIDSPVPAGYQPFSHYRCDLATLTSLNGAATANAACCSGGSCVYGADGTTCPSKTVDGYTYTIGTCPNPSKLVSVSSVKTQLDTFFQTLDGAGSTDANYFIAVITPTSGATIQSLHTMRMIDDANANSLKNPASDRGDRYISLANAVGNGSLTLDLGASSYAPLLDSIGAAIILKKSTFPLSRVPTGQEDMIITLIHADGSSTVIPSSKYTISGNSVVITDQALVLSFAATDRLDVSYQPKYVNQ
jgi:hypothetical protein